MIVGDDARDDLVPAVLACQSCGERRVDELVIHDDETVHCETCGHDYTLPDGRAGEEDKPD